ncbi:MAG: hypothetical protein JEZ05_05845 [Tenericutes bacterium]|nr:hypothetical protein [Mycoplasmatota bacterium]
MKTDFILADIFTNSMVFQHGKTLYIYGECKDKVLIEIKLLNKYYSFRTKGETFCFELEALPIIKNAFDVTLKSINQTVVLKDCLAGDVFLCSGQSNMQYVCKDVINVDYQDLDNLRLYEVPKLPYKGAEKEFNWLYSNNPSWKVAKKANIEQFSAIAYMMGRDIVLKHDLPVGLISCNMGDTTIYSWLEKNVILNQPVLKKYYDNYLNWETEFKTLEAFDDYYKKQVPIQMNFWGLLDKFRAEGYSSEEVYKKAYEVYPCPYLPMGPKNQNRPSGCYEVMLSEVIPFALKAIIYYQGENDVSRADEYKIAIKELIASWRSAFKDDLPFVNIQIAGHLYSDTSGLEVAKLRDSQASMIDFSQSNYLVTAIDYGEEANIHPVNKTVVAKRVFMILDEFIYHSSKNSHSPRYKLHKFINSNTIVIDTELNDNSLHLENTDDYGMYGLNTLDELVKITDITIVGDQIIIKNIEGFKELRYAYDAFPNLGIYTSNSLPLLPFRIILKNNKLKGFLLA